MGCAICLCFVLFEAGLAAQSSRQDLNDLKQRLSQDIVFIQELLSHTRTDKAVSLNDLKLLQRQINNRELIIENIEAQLYLITLEEEKTQNQIDSLQYDLDLMREEYAKTVRETYKSQSAYDKLLFLFSSESVNDAFKRMKYMQYYNDHRAKQYKEVVGLKDTLEEQLTILAQERKDREALLLIEQQEKEALNTALAAKDQLIIQLRSKESHLSNKLGEKQVAMKALDQEIQNVISAASNEVAASSKTIGESPGLNSTAGTNRSKTVNDDSRLGARFLKNKGKLPWPVDEGVITSRFGKHSHPILKNIKTTNNGLDIAAHPSAVVKSLYEGRVTKKLFNPGFQWAVIVKHGPYYTVYANLDEVYVKKGEQIAAQQQIGTVYNDLSERKSEMHLEIWKDRNKLDPEQWLRKR